MIKNIIFSKFIKHLQKIQFGSLRVVTPDSKEYYFEGKNPGIKADITIYDYRLITSLMAKGDIGLAEAYRDNWWDTSNLTDLLTFALKNATIFDQYVYGSTLVYPTI